jgi:hypothetical protein
MRIQFRVVGDKQTKVIYLFINLFNYRIRKNMANVFQIYMAYRGLKLC